MKKLFISLPMEGLTKEEIKNNMYKLKNQAEEILGEPLELLDTYIEETPPSDTITNGLWYICKSLLLLSKANYVYFAKDWYKHKGCIIEHEAVLNYAPNSNLKIISEE